MTKEKKYVPLVAFIITAVVVFLAASDKEVLERIGIAIPWGLVISSTVARVIEGADDEFRQSASVSEKAALLSGIVTIPIVFFWLISIEEGTSWGEAWASMLFAGLAFEIISRVVKYIFKLFEKQQ